MYTTSAINAQLLFIYYSSCTAYPRIYYDLICKYTSVTISCTCNSHCNKNKKIVSVSEYFIDFSVFNQQSVEDLSI